MTSSAAAAQAGAAGAVVDRRSSRCALPQIVVADAQAALERAARSWRAQLRQPARRRRRQQRQDHRQGDDRRDPRAGRRVPGHARQPQQPHRRAADAAAPRRRSIAFAVIEMGANHAGEVAALVAIARPDRRPHHQRRRRASGRLRQSRRRGARRRRDGRRARPPTAIAVINADDEFAGLWRGMTRAQRGDLRRRRTARISRATDVRTEHRRTTASVTRFTLQCAAGQRARRAERSAAGTTCATRSRAAAAAAAAGATLEHIVAGLARGAPVPGRLQLKSTRHGAWLIDDSYNANPSSVHAGIEVLDAARRPQVAGARRHGRARRLRRATRTPRSARTRARTASSACSPSAR